jgi:KUP system potassium uptake protein
VNRRSTAQTALVIGALGVVFGDLGTSPLYTMQTAFNPHDPHPVAVSRTSVFGIVSLVFWSVTIIVTVTYVLLVMRADNDGEGGIMALITLIRRRRRDTSDFAIRNFAGALFGIAVAAMLNAADPDSDYLQLFDAGLAHLGAGLPL